MGSCTSAKALSAQVCSSRACQPANLQELYALASGTLPW